MRIKEGLLILFQRPWLTEDDLRILAIVDDLTRESLKMLVDTSIDGERVALSEFIEIRGKPDCILSDDGTEFTSHAILKGSWENKIKWKYIQPVKPTQNG